MSIKGTVLLALVSAGLALPCRAGGTDPLINAKEAAARGSASEALSIAVAGLKATPADKELYFYVLEMLPETRSKDSSFLASYAAGMLAKNADDPAWYLGLCKTMRVSGRQPEALSNCRKALELDPTSYAAYRELGLTYAAGGNHRKAAETLEQGVEIATGSFQARYNLARELETRGDAVRAASWYGKGLAMAHKDAGPDAAYYRSLMKAGQKRCASAAKAKAAAAPKASVQSPSRRAQAEACAAKFKEEYLNDNLGSALATSDACLKLAPDDPALASGRAPALVRLGRYEEGEREYERAAGLYRTDRQMTSFCRVKAGETWMKIGDPARAIAQYRLALAAAPSDMNALKGLAAAQEARSDTAGALATYEQILAAEPSNQKARARREELKSSQMTDVQILDELKLRQAVDDKKTSALPEDIALFKAMKAAEIGGAVDYLNQNASTTRGLVFEHDAKDGARLMLTGQGYKVYVSLATRAAVRFFEKEGVGMREIFQLRDENGAALFDKNGRLTREGEELWRKAVPGKKKWLMPYDPVPQSPQAKAAKEAEAKIASYLGQGYQEISEPEYLWLLTATKCTDDIMMKPPVNMYMINDGIKNRYLMCFSEHALCSTRENAVLPSYIVGYRNNHDYVPGQAHAGFFGSGNRRHYYCENGRVWDGTPGGPAVQLGR